MTGVDGQRLSKAFACTISETESDERRAPVVERIGEELGALRFRSRVGSSGQLFIGTHQPLAEEGKGLRSMIGVLCDTRPHQLSETGIKRAVDGDRIRRIIRQVHPHPTIEMRCAGR